MSQPPMPSGPPTKPLPQPQFQRGHCWERERHAPEQPPPTACSPNKALSQFSSTKKRFGWPTMIVTAVVALSLGGIVGGSGNGTATTAEPNPTVTVSQTVTETAEVSQTVTETAEAKPASKAPSPKKTTEPEPKNTISDGVHEVGVDVKAGQYKTTVPEGAFCYWERIRGDDISDSTSRYKEGPARQSVTIKKGDSFETEDCGKWKRAD